MIHFPFRAGLGWVSFWLLGGFYNNGGTLGAPGPGQGTCCQDNWNTGTLGTVSGAAVAAVLRRRGISRNFFSPFPWFTDFTLPHFLPVSRFHFFHARHRPERTFGFISLQNVHNQLSCARGRIELFTAHRARAQRGSRAAGVHHMGLNEELQLAAVRQLRLQAFITTCPDNPHLQSSHAHHCYYQRTLALVDVCISLRVKMRK